MLTAVVVLPTPPFWFATAYTVAIAPKIAGGPVGTPAVEPRDLIRSRTAVSSPRTAGRGNGSGANELRSAPQGALPGDTRPARICRRRRRDLLVGMQMACTRTWKWIDRDDRPGAQPERLRRGRACGLLGAVAPAFPCDQEASLPKQGCAVFDQRRQRRHRAHER